MYRLIQQEKLIKLNDLPKGENMTNFSILNDLYENHTFRSFSIKYVFEGCEHYQVNGNKYDVNAGEYLLANTYCEGKIEIDSNSMVKGICIDVSPTLLSEVFFSYIAPDSPSPEVLLDNFFNSEEFLENKYESKTTKLGKTLSELSKYFNKNPFYNYKLDTEFYLTLAENIVEDHLTIINQLYRINSIKHNTRKDLYRRLSKGKMFLENNFNESIKVKNASDYASLSEYHFFRLFKNSFGITPQQYLIQYRLSKSAELLATGNYTISEASTVVGFADVYSFSKAFKKHFGISPSTATRNKANGFKLKEIDSDINFRA